MSISADHQDKPAAMDLRTRFPELFDQTNIDRHGYKRNVEMKVIVIGMMRTGTMCKSPLTVKLKVTSISTFCVTAMRKALKELGYRHVYHMVEVMKNPPDADMWKEAADAKFHGIGKKWGNREWDNLLGEYEVCSNKKHADIDS